MSKLDDIRKMREARYERDVRKSTEVREPGNAAPSRRGAVPADSVRPASKRQSKGAIAARKPALPIAMGNENPQSIRKKAGVRADWNGYMRSYRARKQQERKAMDDELKRLRELVNKDD